MQNLNKHLNAKQLNKVLDEMFGGRIEVIQVRSYIHFVKKGEQPKLEASPFRFWLKAIDNPASIWVKKARELDATIAA